MSILAEYLVVANVLENDGPMEEVNRAIAEADVERRQQFRKLDMDQAGGSKVFTDSVWAACFNHLIPEHVRAALAGADWRYPDAVIMVEDTEYDSEGLEPRSMSITALRESLQKPAAQ